MRESGVAKHEKIHHTGPMQLRAYRRQHRLSAATLAHQCEIDQSQVSHAEAGRPTLFTSIRLAVGTRGEVLPWELKLRAGHRRALRQFAELIEALTVERLRREGRLREAA
jgi:hypothetical protein